MVGAGGEVVEITVIEAGRQRKVQTTATTAGEYLEENEIDPADYRRIFPALDSVLTANTHLFLYQHQSDKNKITRVAPPVRTISTRALAKGAELVIQGGRPGLSKDGRVIEKPEPRVVLRGRTDFKIGQRQELKKQGVITLQATGYSPHALDTAPYDDGFSALGVPASYGLAAVDPRVIPLGTVLYVEGYGYAIAADVGGAIKGRRIDLCFPDRQQALIYGRQWTRVHIIG